MRRLRFTKDAAGNIYLGGQPIEEAYAQRREYVDATERDEELIELHRTIARLRKEVQDLGDILKESPAWRIYQCGTCRGTGFVWVPWCESPVDDETTVERKEQCPDCLTPILQAAYDIHQKEKGTINQPQEKQP